jgi:hypothetical protein
VGLVRNPPSYISCVVCATMPSFLLAEMEVS